MIASRLDVRRIRPHGRWWLWGVGVAAGLSLLPFGLSAAPGPSPTEATGRGPLRHPVQRGGSNEAIFGAFFQNGTIGGYTFYSCNNNNKSTTVTFVFWDESGQGIDTRELMLPKKGCSSAIITDTADISSVTAMWPRGTDLMVRVGTDPDGGGPGSIFRPPPNPSTPPTRFPAGPITATFSVCNPRFDQQRIDVFGVGSDGTETTSFQRLQVPGYTCDRSLTLEDLNVPGDPPFSALAWTETGDNPPPPLLEISPPGDSIELPEPVEPLPGDFGPPPCGLLPPGIGSDDDDIHLTIRNGGDPGAFSVTGYDPNGNPTFSDSASLPAWGSWNVPLNETRNDPPIVVCVDGPADDEYHVWLGAVFGPAPGPGRVTGAFQDVAAPAVPASKKAIAYGIKTGPNSQGSIVAFNGGDKKTKVKFIFRRHDGSKIYGRKMKLAPNKTGVMTIKQKAWGLDFFVEVRVKGKGSKVYTWLQRRDSSGDVEVVPAWVVK